MKLLEVSTDQINVFKTLFKTLGKMLMNINMIFCRTDENNVTSNTNTGFIKISGLNDTKAVFVDLKLESSNFTKFYCANEKVSIGINLHTFNRIIRIITKKDITSLTMYIDYGDTNLKFLAQNEEGKHLCSMELLNLKDAPINVPMVEMGTNIVMSSTRFHRSCKEMYKISDHIELKCSGNKFTMSSVSSIEDIKITRYVPTDNITHSIENCTTEGTFELNDLMAFKKLTTMTNTVEILMKCDYPLIIRYNIPFCRLYIFFSPRIMDNEDICSEYRVEEENSVSQENYKKLKKEISVLQKNYKKMKNKMKI